MVRLLRRCRACRGEGGHAAVILFVCPLALCHDEGKKRSLLTRDSGRRKPAESATGFEAGCTSSVTAPLFQQGTAWREVSSIC